MTVLVTGGAGYIGAHTVRHVVQRQPPELLLVVSFHLLVQTEATEQCGHRDISHDDLAIIVWAGF